MQKKPPAGRAEWVDPDDAPELTEEWFDQAEVHRGDAFVRRGPGRPKSDSPKEHVSIRLDPDLLARLRDGGPGWQARLNSLLRRALEQEDHQQTASRRGSRTASAPAR